MIDATETPLRRHAAWLLVAVAYVYVFPYFEKINNPNENVRVWMSRAIVEHGQLNIGKVQGEWGYVNDKAVSGTMVFSGKAPGTSLLGTPVLFAHSKLWTLFGWKSPSKLSATLSLRLFSVAVPLLVFLWFFARWVERVARSPVARDLLVVGLGVGTLMYPYGITFTGHAQSAALAFSGYMILSDPVPRGADPRRLRSRLEWAGLLGGMAVFFEYQTLLVALLLAIYAVAVHGLKARFFALGALFPALLLGGYHALLFGRPWEFPYGHLENQVFAQHHHAAGFFGLAKPKTDALVTSLFSVSYGLFAFSPVLALGLLCAIVLAVAPPRLLQANERREALVVLAMTMTMTTFLAGMTNWRAGWCVGPRYIAVVAPFLASGVARVWPLAARARRLRLGPALSALTAGLVLASVVLVGISGVVFPHYPEQFDNPVFDLAIPLLDGGFVPYSLGHLLRLPRLWSLAPLALALLVALALGLGGNDERPRRWALHAGAGLVIAAIFLLVISRHGRKPSNDEKRAADYIRTIWQPKDTPPASPAPPARPAPPPASKPSVATSGKPAPARPPPAPLPKPTLPPSVKN